MGMFTHSDKEILRQLYNTKKFNIIFELNEEIDESTNIVLYDHKKPVTIYIRSSSEATNEHWCSVKVHAGSTHGKKQSVPYLVPDTNHPIKNIRDIEIDPKCRKDLADSIDRDYGKVVRKFIKEYQAEIIEYWRATNDIERQEIENKIRYSLSS